MGEEGPFVYRLGGNSCLERRLHGVLEFRP